MQLSEQDERIIAHYARLSNMSTTRFVHEAVLAFIEDREDSQQAVQAWQEHE